MNIAQIVVFLSLAAIPEAPMGTLTVDHALELARANVPALRLARAQTEQYRSLHDETVAAWYPTLSATAKYAQQTGNTALPPGSIPKGYTGADAGPAAGPSFDTYGYFTNTVAVNQLLWDFGQTVNRMAVTDEAAAAQLESEHTAVLQAEFTVRSAFFTAATQRDLVTVAQVNLKNNEAHLAQTKAFVAAGTSPEIDVATSEANRANAVVQLITAKNNYATAKTKLNQAMGVQGSNKYEVEAPVLQPVADEDAPLDKLVTEGLTSRPEEANLEASRRSVQANIKANFDTWFPTISANLSASDNGSNITGLTPNFSAALVANWSVNLGPYIPAEVRVAEAQLDQVNAQIDALQLQVRVDVETAQLSVQAAKESLVASNEARDAANVQLKLAEGRYNAGVGNQVELGDAQLAADQAGAQAVQAVYTLDTARAQLVEALGRR